MLLKSLILWAVIYSPVIRVMSDGCFFVFRIVCHQEMLVRDILVADVAFCGDGGRGRVLFLKSLMLWAVLGELFTCDQDDVK